MIVRPLKFIGTLTVGVFDEEGRLLAEHESAPIALYHPMEKQINFAITHLVRQVEGEVAKNG